MKTLVRGARQLLTLRGPARPRRGPELGELGLIADGAVLIQDGLVQETGPSRRVENLHAARDADEINATGRVVMPGFVDSHTHLISGPSWLQEYEARLAGADASFLSLPDLKATFRSIHMSSAKALQRRTSATVAAMARHGTTSVEAKTGFSQTRTDEMKILRALAKLDRHPLDMTPTLLAAHWGEPHDASSYMEWMISQFLPKLHYRKLARFADIQYDERAFTLEHARRYLETAGKLGFRLKVHAGNATTAPIVRLAVECGAISADHLESAGAEDAAVLGHSATIATLAPAAAYYLGTRFPPAREMIDAGVAVALASDFNPHTSPTCNMQMVLSLACSHLHMTPAESIVAATINGAHALCRGAQTGSLEVGKDADLIILNASDYRDIPYHFGWNHVHLTMKRGTIIYKEGAVARAVE
jgi:imidazolonepropionase